MLTLIFMRQGEKPSRKTGENTDRLTPMGRCQVLSTATSLRDGKGVWPDIIFSSPSRRTHESANLIRLVFEGDEGRKQPKLYDTTLLAGGSKGDFIREGKGFAGLEEKHKTVLCVTHNNVIQPQLAVLAANKYRVIDYGAALVIKFNENSWETVGYDTKPKSIVVVEPEYRP